MSAAAPEPAYRCPGCGASVARTDPWRPFCSERCKMVDLGAWFLGRYRVPAREDDEAEARPPSPPPDDDDADR